jgi:hypothetical protein
LDKGWGIERRFVKPVGFDNLPTLCYSLRRFRELRAGLVTWVFRKEMTYVKEVWFDGK